MTKIKRIIVIILSIISEIVILCAGSILLWHTPWIILWLCFSFMIGFLTPEILSDYLR